MSYEEDERNRRQLREIEDLRQAMRSRYIPIAWIRRWAKENYSDDIDYMINDWRKENDL